MRFATVTTTRADGDFNVDEVPSDELADRQQRMVPRPWTMLHQVHSARVITVDQPGEGNGREADAIVVTCADAVAAVWSGDCAPVVFESADLAAFGIAHAGWRGIEAGVLEATALRLGEIGASAVSAWVGPYIRPCCYEFGSADRQRLADRLGVNHHDIAGVTRDGRPALDVGRAIAAALRPLGIAVTAAGPCTGCDARFFSHRARRERGRHAVAVWRRS
jgi:polyphenol oxidase